MKIHVYVTRLGTQVIPHFTIGENVYKLMPGETCLFHLTEESDSPNIIADLKQKALKRATELKIKVDPRDFD
jgi:hypothetical protein